MRSFSGTTATGPSPKPPPRPAPPGPGNPEELPRIAELQKDLDTLKAETRQRLNAAVESKYQVALPGI